MTTPGTKVSKSGIKMFNGCIQTYYLQRLKEEDPEKYCMSQMAKRQAYHKKRWLMKKAFWATGTEEALKDRSNFLKNQGRR